MAGGARSLARCLLALAASGGGSVGSRVQAKREYKCEVGYFANKIACAVVTYHESRARNISNRRREITYKTVTIVV